VLQEQNTVHSPNLHNSPSKGDANLSFRPSAERSKSFSSGVTTQYEQIATDKEQISSLPDAINSITVSPHLLSPLTIS
jgi:hypothetical protein